MSKPVKWGFPRIKFHMFNGHRFKFLWRIPRQSGKEQRKQKRQGLALYGKTELDCPRRVCISMNSELHSDEYELFATLLHESCHCAFPQQDENSIEAFEHDFIRLMLRLKMELSLPKSEGSHANAA